MENGKIFKCIDRRWKNLQINSWEMEKSSNVLIGDGKILKEINRRWKNLQIN